MDDRLLERARAKGTDREYLEWLTYQPSCLSGRFSEWCPITGRGRSIAAHYRTAANAGIGIKPAYSAIPLTFKEHDRQHKVGQYNFKPREWWEQQVRKHLERWLGS